MQAAACRAWGVCMLWNAAGALLAQLQLCTSLHAWRSCCICACQHSPALCLDVGRRCTRPLLRGWWCVSVFCLPVISLLGIKPHHVRAGSGKEPAQRPVSSPAAAHCIARLKAGDPEAREPKGNIGSTESACAERVRGPARQCAGARQGACPGPERCPVGGRQLGPVPGAAGDGGRPQIHLQVRWVSGCPPCVCAARMPNMQDGAGVHQGRRGVLGRRVVPHTETRVGLSEGLDRFGWIGLDRWFSEGLGLQRPVAGGEPLAGSCLVPCFALPILLCSSDMSNAGQ